MTPTSGHEDQWVEHAGRGSCAAAASWEADVPSASDLAAEWGDLMNEAEVRALRDRTRRMAAAWSSPTGTPLWGADNIEET